MSQLSLFDEEEANLSLTDCYGPEDDCENQHNFVVLAAEDVVDLMTNETERVREIVNLPPAQLRMLLTSYKWDIVSFLENFYDGAVVLPKKRSSTQTTPIQSTENKENNKRQLRKRPSPTSTEGKSLTRKHRGKESKPQKDCEVCTECYDVSKICELSCGHFFCRACLKAYIEQAVTLGALVDCIKCPGYPCEMPLDDDFIVGLLENKLKPKYQQLITSGFVTNNRLIKWCPSPDCSRAIKVEVGVQDQPAVECGCGFRFCFSCKEEIHNMIPCKIVKDFNEVKAATLSTANWVVRYTKSCPQCTTDIEKNGGCNHITCRQCRHEFCWLCKKTWVNNGAHHCLPPEAKAFNNTNMRRLAIFDTKRLNMQQSIKLDQALYKSKFEQQQENVKDQWFKIDFMVEAVELLLDCRRALVDSFVFYYFHEISEAALSRKPINAPHKVQWLLFAGNHKELESATENLSHKLETIVDGENFHEMKREVKDLASKCKGLHRAVTIHVQEGFENNFWRKRADSV